MRWFWGLLLCLCSFGPMQTAYAADLCKTGTAVQLSGADDAPWMMRIQFDPNNVPLNAPFHMMVSVCSQSGALPNRLVVDATMPAHKHGMNYKPKVERVKERQYRAENLLFHMPGVWRIEVIAYDNGTPHRFTHEVDIQ